MAASASCRLRADRGDRETQPRNCALLRSYTSMRPSRGGPIASADNCEEDEELEDAVKEAAEDGEPTIGGEVTGGDSC